MTIQTIDVIAVPPDIDAEIGSKHVVDDNKTLLILGFVLMILIEIIICL
jgi:hypothetical protein